jgi:thiol-disulfide isomerase/thioredoxin
MNLEDEGRVLVTRKGTVLGVIVLMVGILTAACSGGADTTPVASSGAPAPSGPLAADFALPLYSGGEVLGGVDEVNLSDLKGRPVIVNFWAPLCPPCRAEMPDFQEVWEELQAQGSDVVVLGLDVGPVTGLGDRQQAIDFLETIKLTYPTGQAVSADVIRDYKVLGMPTTVFVHRNGSIVRTWTGAITGDKIREITREIIG